MFNSADSVMGKLISGKRVERAAGGLKWFKLWNNLLSCMRAEIINLYEQDPNYEQISGDFVID